jgi:hypothetical protein
MAGFSVSVPHTLGREAALARVQQFLDDVRRSYALEVSDVRGSWDDNRLEFNLTTGGLPVRGTLSVEEHAVHVSGPLPLAVLFFRGRIELTIKQELENLLR